MNLSELEFNSEDFHNMFKGEPYIEFRIKELGIDSLLIQYVNRILREKLEKASVIYCTSFKASHGADIMDGVWTSHLLNRNGVYKARVICLEKEEIGK